MDSFNRGNNKPIVFAATDLEGLKEEIGQHLARAMQRRPRDITFVSYKIPFGFGGLVEAGEVIEKIIPFPIAGTLSDFMSYLPPSTKDVFIRITAVQKATSQVVEQRLQDEHRLYKFKADIPAASFVRLQIMNKGKSAVDALVGFTFQERAANEIGTVNLIGDI